MTELIVYRGMRTLDLETLLMGGDAGVTISLTKDEALVLFEWLSRENIGSRIPVEHEAEQQVLWGIEAELERLLVEPFHECYRSMIAAARERIVHREAK